MNRPENTSRGHQIFKLIRRALKQKIKKVIYLSKEFDSSRRMNLTSMAEAAGASVTESRDEATHLLYPGGTFKKPDNEHCTPLKKWDDRVLVHWWYSPPSYQTWISRVPMIFYKIWRLNYFFPNDELHIILKQRNLEICEPSSFFQLLTKFRLKSTLELPNFKITKLSLLATVCYLLKFPRKHFLQYVSIE